LADYRGQNVLLVFYLGEECPHCMEQLVAISKRHQEFTHLNTTVLAVSSNPPEHNAASLQTCSLPFRLLSDVDFANSKRFHSFDDFEERALHSTLLIDSEGRLVALRRVKDHFAPAAFPYRHS
jgi:peroxiredoxin